MQRRRPSRADAVTRSRDPGPGPDGL